MTATRILYTRFHTVQPFTGLCSKCRNLITTHSYTLGIDVWQDGVLTKTRNLQDHENLCLPRFNTLKGSFPEKKGI